MSKQLEYIIKLVLQEQFKTKPKLVTKTALLDGKATNFIKTEVCPKLGINPNALTTDPRINGFQVIIERKGDVSVDPDETAEILYTPEQLQEDVLDYLETSIGGVWARSRSAGYFWFISGDIDAKDTKNEKKRARYKVVCTYVKADMISQFKRVKINSSTPGWLKTFKQGGLVFDINKINISDWVVRIKDPAEKPELLSIGDTPKQPETSTTTTKQGIPVLDLTPDKISNEILNSIIVPAGGFKVGLKDDNEFYKVQVLMLRFAESIGRVENKAWYNNVKNALNTKENRGDFWDGMPVLKKLGGTQQIISVIKDLLKYKDLNPDIVTSDFIDLLRTKLK
jgi:hypothetical protein